MPKYMLTKDGKVVEVPQAPIEQIQPVERPASEMEIVSAGETFEQPKKKNNLSDLFEVPQPEDNDMATDHLFELEEEDVYGGDPDMSDLLEVTNEDVMGRQPERKVRYKLRPKGRRAIRYIPPTSIQGMR